MQDSMIRYFLLVSLCLSYLSAHPHTFIDVYPKVIIKDDLIKQIDFVWKMDEMTSSMLIMEFDQNGNGKIDKSEMKYINDNYFLPLGDYDFYTHIKSKYKVANFKANISNMRVEYIFSFVLLDKVKLSDLEIKFYDEDFFVAMIIKDKFITQKLKYKISDLDGDSYFGYKIKYK
jgi:ABC-type uncharacterized transport system substrate-binding protein